MVKRLLSKLLSRWRRPIPSEEEALHSRLALVEFWSCFVQVHELSGPVDDQMVTHDELDLETLDPTVAFFVTEFGKLWDSMEQKEGA